MNNISDLKAKLPTILKGFLHEDFKPTNDVYFEMLITHLSGKTDAEYRTILQSPFILEWIEECLEILSVDFNKVNATVTSFMFKLCAMANENEWLVLTIKERKIIDRMQQIVNNNSTKLTPSIKLGYVRLLASVSEYSLGIGWIRLQKAWRFLIDFCYNNHTIYVAREATVLIYEILYKISVKANDEDLCLEILKEILLPILENVFTESSLMVNVDDSDLQNKLSPALDLISYIFQKTLKSEEKTKIAYLCETHLNLETNLWKLAEMTQNPTFFCKVLKAQTSFNFAKLVYHKWTSGKIAAKDLDKFGVNFFNLMKFCIYRQGGINVLKLAEFNHILWHELGTRAPEEIIIENESMQFENQLMTFHLLPVLFIIKKNYDHEELFDNYIMKLFSISCDYTLRICYAFRDTLFTASPESAADLAIKSIHVILSMEKVLNQERAVLVFQAMCYTLKEFVMEPNTEANNTENSDLLSKNPNVLYAVLVGIQTLVKRYRITWKESLETICLSNFMIILLKNPNLSSRLAVQAIKLTQLSIEHFLSPNMALLVDNLNGSGLQCIGPIIMNRFHDSSWEVRDSTLELVTAIASISRLKFPAFQKYLLEYDITSIVFILAKEDSELYVRASAQKCLTELVTINIIWDQNLNKLDLMNYFLTSVCLESEGIVRKETVMLLTKIYNHRKISSNHVNLLYSTMAHCAVHDLHWEVKLNALWFWKLEICRQFTNQGMIDGTFPTVTFSKENKKIVTLTEKEILLRIKKILNELSQIGCLGILLECLDDDCDLEIVKSTVLIIRKLLESLNKYDYHKVFDEPITAINQNNNETQNKDLFEKEGKNSGYTKNPISTELNSTAISFNNISDDVIESIVSDHDINLLANAYENQMNFNEKYNEKINENMYRKFANVTPNEFITKINSLDMDSLVQRRNNWLLNTESFNSLLDDMLYSIKSLNINDIDCY